MFLRHFAGMVLLTMVISATAHGGITVSPFASMSSTKSIKPGASGTEKETTKQRTTYGLQGSLSVFRLLKIQASVGQNELVTTQKTSESVDEFGEIDYEKDMNMSTEDPESEVKISEKMLQARLGIALDPSFWIFIMRAKVGAQATKRDFTLEQTGQEKQVLEGPITYKPYAGAGAGVRFTPRMFFMAEYTFLFYKFPEYEPFMREVSVSFNVSI